MFICGLWLPVPTGGRFSWLPDSTVVLLFVLFCPLPG
jgi:hypothetical protein